MKHVLFASAALTMLLTSCSSISKERAETPARPTVAAVREKAHPVDLTQGAGYFTARFYKALSASAQPNDNLFISPLSLTQGLGLAWLGARGQTEQEMRSLLGWSLADNPAALTSTYNRFLLATGVSKVEIRIANGLWLAQGLPVRKEYLAAARESYEAKPTSLDFGKAPAVAADRINGWVAEQTRGRIDKIVAADNFNEATAAVLTNAVYFKGEWQSPFVSGAQGSFTTADGTRKPIYLMERIGEAQYREAAEGQAIALPYGDGRFVMEVFLPRNAATLQRWEQGLHGSTFWAGEQGSDGRFDLSTAKRQTVLLRLPRFEARFNQEVNDALAQAGMPCAFRRGCADFSGIAPLSLKIDRVAHATFLRVDERGTEAAAATAVIAVTVSGRRAAPDAPRMIVDRPFLVTIRDRASGALIFFGRIADPTAAERKDAT